MCDARYIKISCCDLSLSLFLHFILVGLFMPRLKWRNKKLWSYNHGSIIDGNRVPVIAHSERFINSHLRLTIETGHPFWRHFFFRNLCATFRGNIEKIVQWDRFLNRPRSSSDYRFPCIWICKWRLHPLRGREIIFTIFLFTVHHGLLLFHSPYIGGWFPLHIFSVSCRYCYCLFSSPLFVCLFCYAFSNTYNVLANSNENERKWKYMLTQKIWAISKMSTLSCIYWVIFFPFQIKIDYYATSVWN